MILKIGVQTDGGKGSVDVGKGSVDIGKGSNKKLDKKLNLDFQVGSGYTSKGGLNLMSFVSPTKLKENIPKPTNSKDS